MWIEINNNKYVNLDNVTEVILTKEADIWRWFFYFIADEYDASKSFDSRDDAVRWFDIAVGSRIFRKKEG